MWCLPTTQCARLCLLLNVPGCAYNLIQGTPGATSWWQQLAHTLSTFSFALITRSKRQSLYWALLCLLMLWQLHKMLKLHRSAKSNGLSLRWFDQKWDLAKLLSSNILLTSWWPCCRTLREPWRRWRCRCYCYPAICPVDNWTLSSYPQTPRSRVLTEMRYFSSQPDFEFITIFVWHSQHAPCQVCSDLANEWLANTGYKWFPVLGKHHSSGQSLKYTPQVYSATRQPRFHVS